MKYLGDINSLNKLNKIDINKAKILSEQDIDVFNAADPFFNDICNVYKNPEKKDITINDRRNDIFQNVTFCQDGCRYKGVDFNLLTANCLCKSNFLQNTDNKITQTDSKKEIIYFKTIKKTFIENLFSFNLGVVKCFKIFLNFENLIYNIGFYSMLLMFVLQIIFFIIYQINKLKSIHNFMLKLKANNCMKSFKNNSNKFISKNNHLINKNIIKRHSKNVKKILNQSKKLKSGMNSHKADFILNNHIQTQAININMYNNNINNNLTKEFNSGKSMMKFYRIKSRKYNIKKNTFKSDSFHKMIKNKNIKCKFNKKLNFNFSNNDMQEFDFEEAVMYDDRSYIKMYWGFLSDSQMILDTFFNKNNFDSFAIKLSFLVFTFQTNFFLNALFYSDEYISDAYHNNGVLNIISGLPKSIYSCIASILMNNLLKLLSSSKSELIKIKRKKIEFHNYKKIINIKLSKLRKKLIIYYIFVFLFQLFFLYYVTIFCAVYIYSQKYWLLGCFESIGIDFLSALIGCIFLALFKYISIKKQMKCLFVFTNIIKKFL